MSERFTDLVAVGVVLAILIAIVAIIGIIASHPWRTPHPSPLPDGDPAVTATPRAARYDAIVIAPGPRRSEARPVTRMAIALSLARLRSTGWAGVVEDTAAKHAAREAARVEAARVAAAEAAAAAEARRVAAQAAPPSAPAQSPVPVPTQATAATQAAPPAPRAQVAPSGGIADAARAAGWPEGQIATVVRVAMCESGGDPHAIGAAGEVGLMQIHPVHRDLHARYNLRNPVQNMSAALEVWRASGWRAWSCA